MADETWTVPATVVRVIDGDTVVVDLDLGWRVYRNSEHIRVAGINAPELSTEAGKDARSVAMSLLRPGDRVTVTSQAKPSFERTVGSITIHADVGDHDFGDAMVEAGQAVRV